MFRALVALLRIAKEVKRIRLILEIVYTRELAVYDSYKSKPFKTPTKFSEVIIDTSPFIKRDIYGEVIKEEELEEDLEEI